MATDPRIDAYITQAAPFARPILTHLRSVVRDACPEAEETVKWGVPAFVYKGKLLCMAAGFKAHCAFVLWTREADAAAGAAASKNGALRRITSVKHLPPRPALQSLVREAAARIAGTGAVPSPARKARAPMKVPPDLNAALALDMRAKAGFEKLPPSHRREYVEWITEAKTEPTRERRLQTTLEWLAAGKSRNWRYGEAQG
jgi:uncharacterized protein YdeI (YjbR/CyaY-like superfamily)